MKNLFKVRGHQYPSLALAASLGMAWGASALANTDQQIVTFEVQAINEITVSGNPEPLVISETSGEGGAPAAVTDNSSTYAITTNESDVKITAELDSAMPEGITLTVDMTAPTGGASPGALTLGTSPVDAVTGISTLNEAGLGITYELSATPEAGVVGSDTRTVTFTIVDGA